LADRTETKYVRGKIVDLKSSCTPLPTCRTISIKLVSTEKVLKFQVSSHTKLIGLDWQNLKKGLEVIIGHGTGNYYKQNKLIEHYILDEIKLPL